jgi:hypothetical protein
MLTRTCVCARHADGSVTTFLCPVHADTDPCLTMARVTGRRRTGTIRRGVCTSCGHGGAARYLCKRCGAESPTGIGYACTTAGPLPAPAPDCPHPHAVRVWRAPGRRDPFPVSDSFDTFDAAADCAAELDARAGARGDVWHLFIA